MHVTSTICQRTILQLYNALPTLASSDICLSGGSVVQLHDCLLSPKTINNI